MPEGSAILYSDDMNINKVKKQNNFLVCSFEQWNMTSLSPTGDVVSEPPVRDYVRYIFIYLFYGRMSYGNKNRFFISRLYNLLKRLTTRSLKPGQF